MVEKHANRWLEREDDGPLTIVRFRTKKLDISDTTRQIFEQIYSLVDDADRTRMIVDLSGVDFLSSLALGKLVMLNRKIQAGGGRLALCGIGEHTRDVLEVTHLSRVFNIYDTIDDARTSFQ